MCIYVKINFMKIKVANKNQTKILAEIFANHIKEKGAFISLFGDIGAGKTEFARFVIKKLGIKEEVTSPSFVILNEYKSEFFPIYHFDLYRLEENGLETIKEELREYSKDNVLTFVEWADYGKNELPVEKMEIKISYDLENYSDERIFEFSGTNDYYNEIIQKTIEEFEKSEKLN